MEPLGEKIAEGRDTEIYSHGPGKVIRIARSGRSLVGEAELMSYVHSHGYPVPEVHDAGEGYLVMDLVEGPTMIQHALPFGIRAAAKMLAELHQQLHRIEAPHSLKEEAGIAGDKVLHGDLHPLNVLISPEGPVVIDWSNACRGDPAFDLADTWVLFACADPPMGHLEKLVVPVAKRLFLGSFLGSVDRTSAEGAVPAAVERRIADPNMSDREKERMRAMAQRASRRLS
ncbi:MAG: phosphotransferase [Verrucomicrobiales bacterium]